MSELKKSKWEYETTDETDRNILLYECAADNKLIHLKKPYKERAPIPVIDDVVEVRAVMRGASSIVGAFAVLSLALNASADIIIIDPMISVLLIIGSIGFFSMSKARS